MEARALEYITYAEYLQTDHWRRIRQAAIWAAGGRCQLCHSEQDLEVHHNNYDCLYHETPADVFVMCRRCHEAYSVGQIEEAG